MTREQFRDLKPGDVVRSVSIPVTYQVMGHYGDHVTVARTCEISSPDEWEVIDTQRQRPASA